MRRCLHQVRLGLLMRRWLHVWQRIILNVCLRKEFWAVLKSDCLIQIPLLMRKYLKLLSDYLYVLCLKSLSSGYFGTLCFPSTPRSLAPITRPPGPISLHSRTRRWQHPHNETIALIDEKFGVIFYFFGYFNICRWRHQRPPSACLLNTRRVVAPTPLGQVAVAPHSLFDLCDGTVVHHHRPHIIRDTSNYWFVLCLLLEGVWVVGADQRIQSPHLCQFIIIFSYWVRRVLMVRPNRQVQWCLWREWRLLTYWEQVLLVCIFLFSLNFLRMTG